MKKRRNISLEEDINSKLETLAKDKGLNVSQYISFLVTENYQALIESNPLHQLANKYLPKKKG